MAALDITHEHFDDYNLEQLATGKCVDIYPRSMSRVEAEFVAAFVCLHSPGPVSIQLPAPVKRPIVLAGRTDRRGIVLTDSTTPLMLRTTTGDLAHAELDALLGGDSLNYGCNDGFNDGFKVMGLDCSRGSLCFSGEMSLEGLRLLMAGARWWYGRGASRAVLLSWLRCQQEQDEPAGVAHALGVVWTQASDGPSLAAVSDVQLQEWGIEAADVRTEVLARLQHRCRVLVDIVEIRMDGNEGFCSSDGGREAMSLVSELLPVISPGLKELNCNNCNLGDDGMLALAEVVPQLPYLRHLDATFNAARARACAGVQGLRRVWQAARKPGLWNTSDDFNVGLWATSMDYLLVKCLRNRSRKTKLV